MVTDHHRQISEIRRLACAERPHDVSESQYPGKGLWRDAEFVCELGDEVPVAPANLLHDGTDARAAARRHQAVPGTPHTGGHVPRIAYPACEGLAETREAGISRPRLI